MSVNEKYISVLGVRGVPAAHGGFETFAEFLCLYLVDRGWNVTVYCQEVGSGQVYNSRWRGIDRVHVPVKGSGPLSTIFFDFRSVLHSLRSGGVFLVLGYNTALFNVLHRIFRKTVLINMDGIEWKRDKWGLIAKSWFWINERIGCWAGNRLIADHPSIKDHLATRVRQEKIRTIAYGGLKIVSANADLLKEFDLTVDGYAILIARPEPENSILEIVEAFSLRNRGRKLVVLGNYTNENSYHKKIRKVASDEVVFVGGIYDVERLCALRFFARVYVHGHQVGGTNPSLVEAIGAGNAVLAHDNQFNRWVAKNGAVYFSNIDDLDQSFELLFNDDQVVQSLKQASRENFEVNFRWEKILSEYESLLLDHYPKVTL